MKTKNKMLDKKDDINIKIAKNIITHENGEKSNRDIPVPRADKADRGVILMANQIRKHEQGEIKNRHGKGGK